jgi:predicted ATPase/DNA-binding SARP family transcriptional activator
VPLSAQAAPTPYAPGVEFGILGPLRVEAASGPIDVRRATARTLLVALIVKAPGVVPASTLAEILWADDQPQNPSNALQLQVSYLRKTLATGGERAAIVTASGGYRLDVERDDIDALRFETMVRESAAEPDDPDRALATLDAALGLWRGEALADVAHLPFALGDVTRLTELRWTARERKYDLLLELGRHDEAVSELAAAIVEQPLRERLHEQLALALYRSGRQADALRRLDAARAVLRDELGVDPGPGLRQLEQQILAQDVGLEGPPRPQRERTPALGSRTPGVPVALTPTIGREVEIARVRELLQRHRLVTLTGPGGAGKSRLAIEVARAEMGEGTVWYIDLGSVRDDELVGPTAAATLGIPSGPGGGAAHAVAVAVARDETLFVLDTCEHVIGGAAELAATVLSTAPAARVLATSRRALGLTGEIAWPVPPLAMAPPTADAEELCEFSSAALFCERAEAVRSDFEVTDANAPDIAAICLALDGLPLAIELAAARADALTPAAIRARLDNRFALLVDGSREAAPRQQTLRSTLEWSVDLLSDDARTFFARLSVFRGTFELDAAVAVAGGGIGDPLRVLTDLVRQSMVVAVEGDRYRLLDTLRLYGDELLQAGDAGATRARHAAYYAAFAEAAEPHVRAADQLEWLARLRADGANLGAAADWSFTEGDGQDGARLAGALAWFWTLDGQLSEAIRHLERALTATALPPLVRARALWGYALLAASLGQLDRARDAGAESAAIGAREGDDATVGHGLNARAVAEWALGNHAAAADTHDEAIECFRRVGDPWGLAVCTVLRARTAIDDGDPQAEAMTKDGLAAARTSGDRHIIGIALEQLARVQQARGSTTEVIATATEALAAQESIGYREGTIAVLHVLGSAHAAAGDLDVAERLHLGALALAERIGHAAAVCEALEGLAHVRAAQGRDEEALRLLVVAASERERRQLPARASEEEGLLGLRRAIGKRLADADHVIEEAARLPVTALVATLV